MLSLSIPGYDCGSNEPGTLTLAHLVLDYNGTLALDGHVLPGVLQRLVGLAPSLDIVVVTADTFGTVEQALSDFPLRVQLLDAVHEQGEDMAKLDVIEALGPEQCAFFGQGRNDVLALGRSALGVAVFQEEGIHPPCLLAADVVVRDILHGLDLLLYPKRLAATLRN